MAPGMVVDNSTYAYVLYWSVGTLNNIFGGALVEYTLPGASAAAAVHGAAAQPLPSGPQA